jgi:hypothetical protein
MGVTALAASGASGAAGAGGALIGFRVAVLVVIVGWVLLLAILLLLFAVLVVSRGRGQSRRRSAPATIRAADVAAGLENLQLDDPDFDPQLLLEAAQSATLLVFVATATGDQGPISAMAAETFWVTPFGRYVRTVAGDRRREQVQRAKNAAQGLPVRRWHVPLDYQASAPELAGFEASSGQEQVRVRVRFSQLQAIVQPGAASLVRAGAATNLMTAAGSLAQAVGERAGGQNGQNGQVGLGWLGTGGCYDLTFVRPAGARTDPATALADRTCTTCGATYDSQIAVACAHCQAARPLPWGRWRLAHAVVADGNHSPF